MTFSPDRTIDNGEETCHHVLTRLSSLLECELEPQAVLPVVARTIATTLNVPYVAIELTGPYCSGLLTTYGDATTPVEAFAMVAHGEYVGRLLVAPPRGRDAFTAPERKLLAGVARQAAISEHTLRLIRDLQDSRERLVAAREEERRHLRRDLHDGLGPSLASLSLQLHALSRNLSRPHRAARILDAVTENLAAATADLRHIVDHLGPPILDTGLDAALESQCLRYRDEAMAVTLTVDGTLDGLPAAVEIAAYRVVSEALANVVRHARAGRCLVRVRRDDRLSIEITDDGIGLPQVLRRHGVGLASIRERAEELGGSCAVTSSAAGGTTVRVRFPLPRASVR